jgi:hypothetical protein
MQIGKLVIGEPNQSAPLVMAEQQPAVARPRRSARWRRAEEIARWVFDIDDGAGAVICMLTVLSLFGFLSLRLYQLDRSLTHETMVCKPVDQKSLQVECRLN